MDTELEVQQARSKLNSQLNKRLQELGNADPECCRLTGQIAVYNKWMDSFVQKESKTKVKPESKQA
jgi:hypothetical protein